MAGARPEAIERIVVALPATIVREAAMDAIARLAAWLGAPLLGLFVADSGLLAAAEMPFLRQLHAGGRRSSPLEALQLEAELAAVASAQQRSLQRSAARSGVGASFATHRGDPWGVLSAQTAAGDLIALLEPVSAWPERVPAGAAGLLFVPAQLRLRPGPVIVVTGDDGEEEVAMAQRIATSAGSELIILDWARGEGAARKAAAGARSAAAREASGAEAFAPARPSGGLVVITKETLERQRDALLRWLRGRDIPWLVLVGR